MYQIRCMSLVGQLNHCSAIQTRKMQKLLVALTLTFTSFTSATAACYSVYKDAKVIYQSSVAPVNLSLPFSQTLPKKFGEGASMVYQEGSISCPDFDITGSISISESSSYTPQATVKYFNAAAIKTSTRISTTQTSSSVSSSNYSGSSGYGSRSVQGSVQTGPRGGQYYINSNGNKTYVGSRGSRGR